jgi:hypothetical protein
MSVTAKLVLTDISPAMGSDPQGKADQYQLALRADYDNGVNAEWAKLTPSLSLTMVVKAEVAELFRKGGYKMTLEPVDAEEHAADPELSAQVEGIADAVGGEPAFGADGQLNRPVGGTVIEGASGPEVTDAGPGTTIPSTDAAATPEAAAPKSKR